MGLTPKGRNGLIIAALATGAFFGLKHFSDNGTFKNLIPTKSETASNLSTEEQEQTIKVGCNTWGGHAGGEYFNGSFKASKESRFYKEYGILVEFVLLDDFNASREAFKAGKVDLLWQTIDAFPTEVEGLKEFEPQVIFQPDWSRGGDAIVVRRGINSVADLKGKKIAVAPMTPSQTLLLNMFEAGQVKTEDVQIIEVGNAIDAADLFKKGQVDAAVVWSPDDQACVQAVTGSKVLLNTKTAKNIIADIFFAKKSYVDGHQKELASLVEGWLKGNAEINSSVDAKKEAAKILSEGFSQPLDFCETAIDNARLCTYGDNINFFNINGNFKGVTGESLYSRMGVTFARAGVIKSPNVTAWRTIACPSIIKSITSLTGSDQAGEADAKFAAVTEAEKTVTAVSDKKVTIAFDNNSYNLDDNAKYIIDNEFGEILKGFSGAKIRVEGNTDNVGDASYNKKLSERRAQSVASYLTTNYNCDPNRFVILGNGPKNPVADNSTPDGRSKNRRTDFKLIAQ